ncbi:hypothetical protein C8J56DRAFT_1050924 [Mycena floridula]|nr:hypothetical protein C8J56DRAFT_1050924 [Mycena floridula]
MAPSSANSPSLSSERVTASKSPPVISSSVDPLLSSPVIDKGPNPANRPVCSASQAASAKFTEQLALTVPPSKGKTPVVTAKTVPKSVAGSTTSSLKSTIMPKLTVPGSNATGNAKIGSQNNLKKPDACAANLKQVLSLVQGTPSKSISVVNPVKPILTIASPRPVVPSQVEKLIAAIQSPLREDSSSLMMGNPYLDSPALSNVESNQNRFNRCEAELQSHLGLGFPTNRQRYTQTHCVPDSPIMVPEVPIDYQRAEDPPFTRGDTEEVESMVQDRSVLSYQLNDANAPVYQPGGPLYYPPIFLSAGRHINVAREPLSVSIAKGYNSWMQVQGVKDPLLFIGHPHGPPKVTRGYFSSDMLLKTWEILTQVYVQPRDQSVNDLYDAIYWVLSFDFEEERMVIVFLALTQVFETYNAMFFAKNEVAFRLNPDYHMLGVLESPLGFLSMKGYVTALQNRVLEARDRMTDLVSHLQWLMAPSTDKFFIPERKVGVSSVESVREEFSTRTGREEIDHLLLRDQYARFAADHIEVPPSQLHRVLDLTSDNLTQHEVYYCKSKNLYLTVSNFEPTTTAPTSRVAKSIRFDLGEEGSLAPQDSISMALRPQATSFRPRQLPVAPSISSMFRATLPVDQQQAYSKSVYAPSHIGDGRAGEKAATKEGLCRATETVVSAPIGQAYNAQYGTTEYNEQYRRAHQRYPYDGQGLPHGVLPIPVGISGRSLSNYPVQQPIAAGGAPGGGEDPPDDEERGGEPRHPRLPNGGFPGAAPNGAPYRGLPGGHGPPSGHGPTGGGGGGPGGPGGPWIPYDMLNRPNNPRDPSGPGGPGEPGGPGGPGDPGDPDNPDYPRTNGDNYYNPRLDEWQLNNKVNTSQVPSWDGNGDTAIEYFIAINNLSKLGWKVVHQMGYILLQKWTGSALAWWNAIPEARQETMRADVMEMVFGLRGFFLNPEWVEEHTKEFEEIRFHKNGCSNESPAQFLQRRIRLYNFLFSDSELDGPSAISRILRTAPPAWSEFLNSTKQNSVLQLLLNAELRKHSLISAWKNYCNANDLRKGVKSEVSPVNKSYRRFNNRSHSANHVTIEEVPDEGDSKMDTIEKSTKKMMNPTKAIR